ncbi:MAG: alpha-1,4-glucan--maltose-1-phosphate maltosyltransferase [Candidatus Dormibacteria bacterium]
MLGQKEIEAAGGRALMHSGRVAIERCRPTVDGGEHVAKASLGLPVQMAADIFADGFDLLLAWGRLGPSPPGLRADEAWVEFPLTREHPDTDDDSYSGWFTPTHMGLSSFEIVAMRDEYGTWLHDLHLRAGAGQDLGVELEVGALIAERHLAQPDLGDDDRKTLELLVRDLRRSADVAGSIARAAAPEVVEVMRRTADRSRATTAGPFPLWVDRERAGFSAWYELFPRSEGGEDGRSGTFRTAMRRLAGVAQMGFDILYLPPIHPIGTTARRGRNNSDAVGPDDPGSPWAIGAETGGHTAIHPDLGSAEDFAAFVAEARRLGMEVALDYARQCSPEHPWVTEHPLWFKHRPDGSVRYAENPPKRYFDIYPFDFDTPDREAMWQALLDIVLHWIGRDIRAFRVDNPHTKPFAFWQWLIRKVHRDHPDVIFLAEAFTRDTVRNRLSKVGFTQSYTDFTWRNTKSEVAGYLTMLASGDHPDWFRPNFWVNTPDILPEGLHHAPPSAFRLRMVLAAISGPSWGMYSGYELGENVPVRPGGEDYIDSEKYELRPRDWNRSDSMAALVTQLNDIRRRHRGAIAQLRTLRLHPIDNDQLLCISRSSADGSDVLVTIINLDPNGVQRGTVSLDLTTLGIAGDVPFEMFDELSHSGESWNGPAHVIELDPATAPAYVFHLRR